jgi:hypothetical protein
MSAQHDLTTEAGGFLDHDTEIINRHAHSPAARERHRLVIAADPSPRLEMLGHRLVAEPAEVVVEHLLARRLSGHEAIAHRVVLEQVLAAVDRPHLPPW